MGVAFGADAVGEQRSTTAAQQRVAGDRPPGAQDRPDSHRNPSRSMVHSLRAAPERWAVGLRGAGWRFGRGAGFTGRLVGGR